MPYATVALSSLKAGLLAGTVAITVNTLALKLAHPLGIVAESGGLLRLGSRYAGPIANGLGITHAWAKAGLPGPASPPVWLVFHYLTGFGMVRLYVRVLEPRLPGNGLAKGSLFSLLPWLINGLLVLPMLGQGVLGWQVLSAAGMTYFFAANGLFGGILGIIYQHHQTTNQVEVKANYSLTQRNL